MGAAIGAEGGDALPGAVIGGAAGALAGGVLGSVEDANVERDQALLQRDVAVAQASYNVQANALTNFDLIRMAQGGLSDDVIINQIVTRGGRFELTTDAIIALKRSGVSDRVILAAQTAPGPKAPVIVAAPRSPDVIYVEPAPPPVVYHSWDYHPYHHPWHHRHHSRSRVGVSVGF